MYDTIITLGNSKIQHGQKNHRIYLMHLADQDMPEILTKLDDMAKAYGYSKIFAKVPKSSAKKFLEKGYVSEATVPGFYKDVEDCIFMSKFLTSERNIPVDLTLNKKVVEIASSKKPKDASALQFGELPEAYSFRLATESDAPKMAAVYAKVFDSYPFPVFNPAYIKETMADNVIYFGIWNGNEIIALSSCEMCVEDKNVEMTDFAILPQYRGHNFSYYLLGQMEKEMKKKEIKTAYTIARSASFGMNNTFAKCGYSFCGTLIKNTQIGGTIEDMNVWYKAL